MSPRTGRPKSDNPKSIIKRARMTDEDVRKLKHCSKSLGVSESEVMRLGIDKVYKGLKK